jgi:chemotaxis protein CheX
MKAQYINPFIKASMNLFRDYLGVNVTHGSPFINKEVEQLQDVSAIIGLAGETVGAVVLSFDRETAIQIVSIFATVEFKALTSDVLDGVGELVNILVGNAKKDLADTRIDISLPGVITGKQYKINWPKGVPVITIPFESGLGKFTVNVSMREG